MYGSGTISLDPALVRPHLLHYLDEGYEL